MVRRRLTSLAIVALFAACSFPTVSFENGSAGDGGPGDGASGVDGTSGDGSGHTDGAAGDDATAEGSPGEGSTGDDAAGEGASGDDAISQTDAPYVFEAAADAPACDHDEDNDNARGATCGGTDCDDNDPRAYTGEPNFLTYAPTPVTMGDWNCDGIVETEFTTGFNCGLLSTGNCAGKAGFTDTPGCGQTSSKFITCKVSTALLCVTDTTTTSTQGCK